MLFSVTDHFMRTARHASFYLASGPEAGPLIIFVHGWPELSHSWRHQLRCFAALGFRCVAPDMRGYGRSGSATTGAARSSGVSPATIPSAARRSPTSASLTLPTALRRAT